MNTTAVQILHILQYRVCACISILRLHLHFMTTVACACALSTLRVRLPASRPSRLPVYTSLIMCAHISVLWCWLRKKRKKCCILFASIGMATIKLNTMICNWIVNSAFLHTNYEDLLIHSVSWHSIISHRNIKLDHYFMKRLDCEIVNTL